MYPISDLTAFCRKTTGDVPPKLVGASTTVVGSKMYLYGGRLVSERKMVSDIYVFDLETFKWERVPQSPEDDVPQARYFHSADTWRNHLIIFGGMAIKPQSDNPEDLCVLNDVRLFDLNSRHWLPSVPVSADSALIPNARYAHLSSVTADRLFIIGGQDLANVWLDDVYIFDLVAKTWICRRDYPRHCGTYRSVAVTSDQRVRLPQDELRGAQTSARLGQPGTRFNIDKKAAPTANATQSDSLIHLPYSAAPTDEYPCDIFLFSNYNFTDVQRELEVFTPLSEGDFTVSDRSSAMTGTSFPPGLRFPTGAILGTFFIVAGTYLSQTYQSFSIWALDLINMTWSRIDPGSALASGSWFRSCLWASANKFVVFGNRHGNLVEDYNRRLLSWDHVTCIDLEAFGIYQPPPLVLDIPMQELGLGALEESLMADFEIICDDGRRIKVSRKLLEDRWPWFKEQRNVFLQAASRALEAMPSISSATPSFELPTANRQDPRPDPRLTARSFNLSEPYPISLAFMQYFYSMSLITPLQHAPAVLSQLLLLSSTYQLTHLQSLVKHAMHRALSYATSVGIYGVSTLCSCRSLQIRALRVVMAYSQKRPANARVKTDKDGGAGGRGSDTGGGTTGGGRIDTTAARPRGLSDASYMRGGADTTASRGFGRGAPISESLAVLADLQEFGIPGHEVPIPTLPISKRFSDASLVLPSLNEEEAELDFSNMPPAASAMSSPVIASTRPAPWMSQPTPRNGPQYSRSRRMGSIDALAPLDALEDGDIVPLKSLPVPRRMASMDTVSSQSSSSRDGRGERTHPGETPSPSQTPPPSQPHSFVQPEVRPTPRPLSIMSQSTEQDLLAIAEMLSPTIDATIEEEEPIPETPTELENSFSDMFIGERAAGPSSAGRSSLNSSTSSMYSAYQPAPSLRSSEYTDSDGASYMGDELPADPTFLVPPLPHGYRHLNLPRGSLQMPPLDDSHSVSSATSYSSLRTPSISRAPSLPYLASPPTSPGSSHSPIDMQHSHPFSAQSSHNNNSKMLGIIEESLHAEEDHRHFRQHSDETETASAHGETESEQNHASRAYASASYFQTRSPLSPVSPVFKSDSSSDLRSAAHSLYKSDSRGNLHALHKSDSRGELRSPLRGEARSDARNGSQTHSSKLATRRGPELQRLQISTNNVTSPASAPAPDVSPPSPFRAQHPPYEQQSHSAYPSYTYTPPPPQPSAPASQQPRSSHANNRADRAVPSDDSGEHSPSVYGREMQAPFGKLRSAYSVELLAAAFNAGSVRARESPVATQAKAQAQSPPPQPRYAPLASDAERYAASRGYPLPPLPPVPLSPVLSAGSGSSSGAKSVASKKKGLGKLFSRGGDKDKSSSSVHYSNRSVASFDTGVSKDEARRAKKEAARARTERLAQDLAEKAKRRAAEAKARKEVVVRERSKRPWEEGGGMYEGISTYL